LVCALLGAIALPIAAGTPEQEKAFTDKYQKAFEGKDTATLESFLYTQGADPEIVGFSAVAPSGIDCTKTIDLIHAGVRIACMATKAARSSRSLRAWRTSISQKSPRSGPSVR